ncbi:hypothetical protein JCM10207_003868 [Rhodosporidiobolus poonsookiae]
MAHDALHEARTVDSLILASSKGAGDEGKEHGDEGAGGQAGSSTLERLPDELLDLIFHFAVEGKKKAGVLCISKGLHLVGKRAFFSQPYPLASQRPVDFAQLATLREPTRGPLPLRHLTLRDVSFFYGYGDADDYDPSSEQVVRFFHLLAQTSVEHLELVTAEEPTVPPPLPLVHSVRTLFIDTFEGNRFYTSTTFPTILALLRAFSSLQYLKMLAFFSMDNEGNEIANPSSEAFLLANPNLPALLIYLRSSQVIYFQWRNNKFAYRYVRSSTTDDFQVDRIKRR